MRKRAPWVGVGSLRTGIFNVADVAIMLGMILTVGEGFRSRPQVRSEVRAAMTRTDVWRLIGAVGWLLIIAVVGAERTWCMASRQP